MDGDIQVYGEASTPPRDVNDGDGIDYSVNFVTEELFDSYEDACLWCKQVAVRLGFEVVKSSKKTRPDGRVYAYLRCNRGERYRGKDRDFESAPRPNTSTKACDCQFVVKVAEIEDSKFRVYSTSKYGFHNHKLFVYGEGHRQVSVLTPPMKEKIREMTVTQSKAGKILLSIKKKFAGSTPNIQQIYNERAKIKKENAEDRSSVEQFAHLAGERGYVLAQDSADNTGALTHAFVAHPVSVKLFRTYPYVICMDCTYKTNRYKMPMFEMVGVSPTNNNFLIGFALMMDETEWSYRWVLSKLRALIGDFNPHAILTDRELGLMKPVAEVFPNSAYLLCTWHIRKDVNAKVYNLMGKNKHEADIFENGRWAKVMSASSDFEYNEAIRSLYHAYGHRKDVIKYVEDTWLVHKEKFVKNWTNRVRHFGNTTTNRVESQHSLMKSWIESGRSAMDTLFERADASVEVQLTKIRNQLEQSMGKMPGILQKVNKAPFHYLRNRVSLHCLRHLQTEQLRIKALGDDPMAVCECVIRSTHGIPCACYIWNAMHNNIPITVDEIDIFWRTLTIGDGVDIPQRADQGVYDVQQFEELACQVPDCDPFTIREVNRFLRRQLFPEDAGFDEPHVKVNVKGRPKGSTSTRREPSAFEYTESRGRGRGRGRGSMSRSSSKRSSKSSVKMSDVPGNIRTDILNFPYPNSIPGLMMPHLSGWHDPAADGNCGFRCIASAVHGSEDQWPYVRLMLEYELNANRHVYGNIYGSDALDSAINRIHWTGARCGEEHYMEITADLFPIAKCYDCAIMYYTSNMQQCVTVLPWTTQTTSDRPSREICITLQHNHYIRLHFDGDYPVPPIAYLWHRLHDESVGGWDVPYSFRNFALGD